MVVDPLDGAVPDSTWDGVLVDLAVALGVLATTCREAGLELDPGTAWRNDEGWAYHTIEVMDLSGQPWIFRFPSCVRVEAALQRELALLPWLGGQLPVPVPRPRLVGHAPPFMGYRRLDGDPLATARLEDPAVADAVADLLVAIHSLPVGAAVAHGLTRYDPTGWRNIHCGLMSRAREATRIPVEIERRWALATDDPGLWPDAMTVVHGDICPPHLLEKGGRLTGLIDWESARVADPALDLAGVLSCWGEEAFSSVLVRYRRQAAQRGWTPAPRLVGRARFLASLMPLHTIVHGLDSGREEYISLGTAALHAQLDGDAAGPARMAGPSA